MKATDGKKLGVGLAGAVVSAVATSSLFLALSCCAGPVVFLALGLGFASISTFESFASYKWLMLSLTILFLLIASLQVYKQERAAKCETSCPAPRKRRHFALLIAVAFIVIALLIFPFAYEKYLLQVK
jgi:mercuric ion transport protein